MYETYFKLAERPFAAAPVAQRFFPAAASEHARQTLRRTIDRAEGAALVVGPSGTGKSLMLQVLANEFRDRFLPVTLSSGRFNTARALLQAVLFELNLPYRHMDESELRLSLVDHLTPPKFEGEGLLLLVDEAHTMSCRLLEELRMITNLTRGGKPIVRVVLAGNSKLEERFASPKLDSFSQRLSARCYLEALSREETAGYVKHQIECVGGKPNRIFDGDALTSVYRATDGIPRLVNQVCDHAMLLAELGGLPTLNSAAIEEAWADLQQLPAPWNATETKKSVPGTRVVEFGGLDDISGELPEAIPFPAGTVPTQFSTSSQFVMPTQGSVVEFGGLVNPDVQLDQLQSQIEELDEDFQPAGSIGPEVELVFRGGNNPFGDFVEEEVVLDRYSSLEADIFSRSPVVTSRESRELSAMLSQHTRQPAEATVPLKQTMTEATQVIERQPAASSTTQTAAAVDDDEDLIVVEDDPQMIAAVIPKPTPLVRKQEYRQLFAKLRRG